MLINGVKKPSPKWVNFLCPSASKRKIHEIKQPVVRTLILERTPPHPKSSIIRSWGGTFGISSNSDLVNIMNNIFSGVGTSISGSPVSLTGSNNLFYGNSNDPNPLTDPVYADPDFIDPLADDYHIGEDSPAVDAGATVALSDDFDGDERPIGEGYDIGADEVESGCIVFFCPISPNNTIKVSFI